MVDPTGAAALWAHLPGLLHRSRWRRLLEPRPHIAWEYQWTARRVGVAVWVPGPVSAGPLCRAVTAAWPGATLTVDRRCPPVGPRRPAGWLGHGRAGAAAHRLRR
ncbi:MAG: hypothetical protein L0Y54_22480 [Sporichthyaceae bacterium]|nr:hypothetical protein [Sporichthyaceae bacterium]